MSEPSLPDLFTAAGMDLDALGAQLSRCPPPAPAHPLQAKFEPVRRVPSPAPPSQPAAHRPAAQIVPFPLSRDVRLIRGFAAEFMKLRARHGRRARPMLIEARFKPIRARLRRLKVPADVIRHELCRLEAEVAGLVWEADGCPGSDAGGGGAA